METYLILCCLLAGVYSEESVISVSGYVGGSAEIRCPYDGGYEGYSKYLCRGECPAFLSIIKDIPVKTEEGQTTAVSGRFSLHDDTTARVFTVTITGLTAMDSGKYWCAIETGFGKSDVYTEVALTVKGVTPSPHSTLVPPSYKTPTLPSSPPTSNPTSSAPVLGSTTSVYSEESVIRVTGYVGGSAEIRCPYDGGYETYSKYLCRGECPAAIFSDNKDIPVKTEEGQTTAVSGRFSLHDDTTARVFTVTITGLTVKDFGKYWCGVETGLGSIDAYTEVELHIEKDIVVPPSYKNHTLPSSPPTSNPTSSAPVLGSTTTPDGRVMVLVMCAVGLIVLLGALASAAYCRQRRTKQSTGTGPASLHSGAPSQEAHEYEMCEELGSVPEARVSINSLYYTAAGAQLPTVHSTVRPVTEEPHQPIYCNSQEDNAFAIYANAPPEGTTSPTMQCSRAGAPLGGANVNTPLTLVKNFEDDDVYSVVQLAQNTATTTVIS
ncbi:hypothetical protein ACEWY4_017329 [Coilia grayii]|uniref:Immunoglobulin domain-containing protein n=1 Tax=Coilia grayii TaxID=363190 RepID=A0ABD1JGI7_9TELE